MPWWWTLYPYTKMASDKIPPVPPALVEYLGKLYPNTVPNVNMTDREVWIAVGKQEVITKLRQMASTALEQPLDVVLSG